MSASSSSPRRPRIAALLLAAGLSRRMGSANKLLADVGGEAMVRRAAQRLLGCGLDLYVVTGHEREKVEAALRGLALTFVHNPAYSAGQHTSVRAGLAAAGAAYDGVLVALGDQPALTSQDIAALVAAYAEGDGSGFLVPYYAARRGNPVVIPASLIPAILETPQDGAGPLTDRFADRVRRFEAPNDHYLRDIDTEEALAHFRQEQS